MKKLLLILFSVSLFTVLFSLLMVSYQFETYTAAYISHLLVLAVSTFGMLAYAFQRAIFFPQLWRALAYLTPLVAISFTIYCYSMQGYEAENFLYRWCAMASGLFFIPVGFILYFYSDKNSCLWISSKRNLDALLLDSILYDHKKIAITKNHKDSGPIKLSIEKIKDDLYSVYMICKEGNRDVAFSNQFFTASSVSRFIAYHAGVEIKDIERKYF